MAARYGPWIAIAGGGVAWTVHLFAGYFLVALGCPRSWPVSAIFAAVTLVTAGMSVGLGVMGVRGWRRAAATADEDGEARRLIFAAATLLAGLFTLAILLGGVTALSLPPCRDVGIGG